MGSVLSKIIQVVWFKRDLRLFDHAPLYEASQRGSVIPLYVVEPDLWQLPDASRRHWHFIHDCLTDLGRRLKEYNSPLIIRVGSILEVLENLRQQLGHFVLHSHEETGNNWTYERDKEVAAWCRHHNIPWHEYPTNGVVRRLKSRDGWSRIRDERMAAPIIPLPPIYTPYIEIKSDALPAKDSPLFGRDPVIRVQAGGRTEAEHVLNSFLKERGRQYMLTISKPGVSARHCSRLSPHLTYGTLSVREVEQATKQRLAILSDSPDPEAGYFSKNLEAFLSRLAWHCHFIQKLEQQPDIEFKCMHPAFEGMREPHFRQDYFEAWKTGQTGYPLIDACMRSLIENGWLTFRMRAMLVSFASYHLWLDWRQTAPYLAKLFTDYEPGIHYSQFQMQSGVTGINAVRMYSPVKQSYDHDGEGKFIRRFVPELQNVATPWIHEPWRLAQPPLNYPSPIVEHEPAIRRARAEISRHWKSEGFRDTAKAVNEKLGSRNRPVSKPKKVKKKPIQQLSFDL